MSDKLTYVLQQLLSAAQADGKASLTLKNGLKISLRFNPPQVHLYLSRNNAYPSDSEFTTVIKHLPYTVAATSKQVEHEGRFYLVASWPEPNFLL